MKGRKEEDNACAWLFGYRFVVALGTTSPLIFSGFHLIYLLKWFDFGFSESLGCDLLIFTSVLI